MYACILFFYFLYNVKHNNVHKPHTTWELPFEPHNKNPEIALPALDYMNRNKRGILDDTVDESVLLSPAAFLEPPQEFATQTQTAVPFLQLN